VATYRLMDGVSGRPGTGSSGTTPPGSSDNFGAVYNLGTLFEVTSSGLSLTAIWVYVPDSSVTLTGTTTVALWQVTGTTAGTFLASGTTASLSVGWNRVSMSAPYTLTSSTPYLALWGLNGNNGPITNNQFSSGQPYASGITNGPLLGYSSNGGSSNQAPFSNYQGVYGGGSPTGAFPNQNFGDSNFWADPEVTSAAARSLIIPQAAQFASLW